MPNLLRNKVALVVNAGVPIGQRISSMLSEEGASLVINHHQYHTSITKDANNIADVIVEDIKNQGGNAVSSYENPSTFDSVRNMVSETMKTYGSLDILINCTPIHTKYEFSEINTEEFDQVVKSHLKGTFNPIKHASAIFREQKSGRIVNFTSDAGIDENGGVNNAAVSEAIVGLTRTIARDLGKYGVTCNAISIPQNLAIIDTAQPASKKNAGHLNQKFPLNIDNAAALCVLLSTETVPNINGQVFGTKNDSIHLYSTPSPDRSSHNLGPFSLSDLESVMHYTFGQE